VVVVGGPRKAERRGQGRDKADPVAGSLSKTREQAKCPTGGRKRREKKKKRKNKGSSCCLSRLVRLSAAWIVGRAWQDGQDGLSAAGDRLTGQESDARPGKDRFVVEETGKERSRRRRGRTKRKPHAMVKKDTKEGRVWYSTKENAFPHARR
jgi:hypothetical protein